MFELQVVESGLNWWGRVVTSVVARVPAGPSSAGEAFGDVSSDAGRDHVLLLAGFAAWRGLTLSRISPAGTTDGSDYEQGDSYLRHLLDIGTRNVVRSPKARSWAGAGWIEALLERRQPMVVAVANKLARIVWAMMTSEEFYRPKLAA
ncbi:hypothetical protein [Bradyrhizobium sp. CCBAU 53380]|uniref:hypothetical protein n=1 Tax=Bradyrhizobium sp. CCBAU 53380 TaxID=1325117 RepID=UPI002303B8D0|nr:hypothetical protein [Bradyrhizobium sp. CCBAU 53380]MDA9421093.1 hypothetical protein [Bradyrhizobium sp. CCBAU 53380]